MIVPEPIFNHVKAQAYLSGMRFPEYVARFLKEAWPLTDNRQPVATSELQVAEIVSPQDSEA
ncbi:hypothetical protein A6X21_09765 [Planctopirus hydrillae]|uniref:Uncharacterized protein n=1 Tax=Planctopirus hydrillae TaxID=1841610 RepID=A0A1C3E769_9PLAN|nr:hypothetical protein A6X21_09765 [Planctopirus hydrillae]